MDFFPQCMTFGLSLGIITDFQNPREYYKIWCKYPLIFPPEAEGEMELVTIIESGKSKKDTTDESELLKNSLEGGLGGVNMNLVSSYKKPHLLGKLRYKYLKLSNSRKLTMQERPPKENSSS